MGKIKLEEIELFAYHGCLEEEKLKGNWFMVNIDIETDINIPSKTDQLTDALDYKIVYEIVKQEMEIRSHLLENVTKRIIDALFLKFYQLEKAVVKVSKMNPPIGGKVKCVSVELSQQRQDVLL